MTRLHFKSTVQDYQQIVSSDKILRLQFNYTKKSEREPMIPSFKEFVGKSLLL